MSDNLKTALLQIRITPKLAADLKRVADQETNTSSAVARRFLTAGISLELKSATRRDNDR